MGIFLKRGKFSSSVAIPDSDSSYSISQIHDTFLIRDPVYNLGSNAVRMALNLINKLADGKHLPKDFDVNISWGVDDKINE